MFHPFNPPLALRASSLVLPVAARNALIDAPFLAVWVRGLHVSEPDVVKQRANEAGLEGSQVVSQAGLPEARALLRARTDPAISDGVFGVPCMAVGGRARRERIGTAPPVASRDAARTRAHRGLGLSFGSYHLLHLAALGVLAAAFPQPFLEELQAITLLSAGTGLPIAFF